jgi:hypothetical protein
MGSYTRSVTKFYDFDGDKVTVNFRRLLRSEAMELSPYMQTKDDGSVTMTMQTQFEFADVAAKVLKKVINTFSGLTIDGKEITEKSEEYASVFDDVYFMSLLMQIMGDVMSCSFVVGDTEKK